MIKSADCVKRFNSAKVRFLKGALNNFFKQEFPKLIGPILRDKLIDELIKLLDKVLPLKDHLKPGQIVWNAVDIHTRADSKNPKFVPVTLTIINEEDIEKLANGAPMSEIRDNAIARIENEAYRQGALLSMRDIGLLTLRDGGSISNYRIKYEKEHNIILPHTGSLQDMGSCISHKAIIIKKIIIDKKDPYAVAKETNHSMLAVDRYLKDFYRVQYCFNDGKDIEFTSKATGLNKFVVEQYFNILQNFQKNY
ncbi:MAG: DUF1670 domain-containing protein [Candidatus Aminicenantia bacterium]